MQARLVFAFSAGHQIAPALGYLELAQHGVNFLINKAWDQRYGGWFAQISADGTVQDPKKRVFDQAYLLIGLSDYYRLHRDGNVLDFILETYDKLEYYAWDQNYLGYHEVFQDDWGIISDRKTICIQLDMLRAVLSLWKATSNNRFVQRAFQLGDLVVGKMCDPILGCTLEIFHSDWRYAPARMRDRVWSGHILKGAWLLLELDAITPNARYVDTAVRMVDYCLHYAWDNPNGGFYQFLYRTGRLASSTKLWWSQTEGLNALLALYRKTGEPRYWHAFTRLVEFSFQNFVDWEYGEWYTSCTEDGKPSDDRKGGDTKSAYHTVQTCIMLAKGLETLAG
jgi:mannobiose 2-epimerase